MDHRAIPEQVLLEHEMLTNIIDAIRAAIGWKYQGEDLSRKLTSLSFAVGSLERHLQHLMKLEEDDGYMEVIEKGHPQFHPQIAQFRGEHAEFRRAAVQFGPRLEAIGPHDHAGFTTVCNDLLAFLHRIEEHDLRETELIREALMCGGG